MTSMSYHITIYRENVDKSSQPRGLLTTFLHCGED
jgi:hypothetical protein